MIRPKSKANSLRLLALAATTLLGCSAAHAASYLYNVDCNGAGNNTAANTYSGAAILGNAGDTWNAAVSTSALTLQSTTSGAPTITFTNNSITKTYYDTGGTTSNPTLLMQDYLYNDASTTGSLTLSNLTPGAAFSLVLYGSGDAVGQGDTLSLTGGIGGNTASTLTTSGTDRDITRGIGDAYNTFTGTVGAGGTLTVTVATNGTTEYSILNGLQLQETVVPEPATWVGGLGLLGAAGLTLRQRRGA